MALAHDLRRATRRAAAAAPKRPEALADRPAAGRVPQDTSWSQDTSGFGLSQPAELSARARRAEGSPSWFAPMDWLRRSAAR
jgi:hypothetical protein